MSRFMTCFLFPVLLLLSGSSLAQADHPPLPVNRHASVANLPVAELAQTKILMRFGRTEEAIISFDALLTRYPGWVPALAERAYLLRLLGRHAEAKRDRDEAQRLNPVAAGFYTSRGSFSLLPYIALYPDDWFNGSYREGEFFAGARGDATFDLFQRRQSAQLEEVEGTDAGISFLQLKLRGEGPLLDQAFRSSSADHSRQWQDLMQGNLALLRQDLHTALQYYNDAVLSGAHWPELYYNRGLTSILLHDYANGCTDLNLSYAQGFLPGEIMLRNLCTF